MGFELRVARGAASDFRLIYRHLNESYRSFGETSADARLRATQRVLEIRMRAHALTIHPFRGQRDDDVSPGLRHVTMNRAIYYFTIDEPRALVTLVGVFLDGQEHRRRMLLRLLSE
jgi:toxin ParE1/3/4